MSKKAGLELLVDADILSYAIRKYRRDKKLHALIRSFLAVLAVLSILCLILLYSPLRTIVDLARVTLGNKYMVVFANDAELRSSGGFIGSFAIIDAQKYIPRVERIETNIYREDNLFAKRSFVAMPETLSDHLGTEKSWTLHDSNWDPDFAISAQYINWFYGQEYNDDIDGVLLINTSAIKRLLRFTGPVKARGIDDELTADNIYELLGDVVENKYWQDPRNEELNQPKTVIADLEPLLLNKAIALPYNRILQFVRETLDQKEIVIWNKKAPLQSIINKNNWSGTFDKNNTIIASINSTIGTKTSQNISEDMKIAYNRADETISISETRTQTAAPGAFGSVENQSFAQLLLPPGSEFESFAINGIEFINKASIQTNTRYSSMGSWVKVDSRAPLTIVARATLPGASAQKPFCVYKQVGSQNKKVEIIIDSVTVYNGELKSDVCF